VLQEFYVQASRAMRPDVIVYEIAARLMRTWMRSALEIKATYLLSYWDAAIVAAARALGCRELFYEDMSHGREIEGVTIHNPFRWR
jgi:predicted nucleic acid-binding protein